MQSNEVQAIYDSIKSSPETGQDFGVYLRDSCAKIAVVTASSMAETVNQIDLFPAIATVLIDIGEGYVARINSFADPENGSFKRALRDPSIASELTTYAATAISLLNKSELPKLLVAARLEQAQPTTKVLRSLPLRLIQKMAGMVVEGDTLPAHNTPVFIDTAMEKIETYGDAYLTRFFATYARMLGSNSEAESPSRESLDTGAIAIQLANMTWQQRQVTRHVFDLTTKGSSTRLQNYQFASFNTMLANTFERNRTNHEKGLAAVEVALLQDFIECV